MAIILSRAADDCYDDDYEAEDCYWYCCYPGAGHCGCGLGERTDLVALVDAVDEVLSKYTNAIDKYDQRRREWQGILIRMSALRVETAQQQQ